MVFILFSEFTEIKIEVDDLTSQIFFVIFVYDHNKRLHAKFQPSISILRTKCSLYKICRIEPSLIHQCKCAGLNNCVEFIKFVTFWNLTKSVNKNVPWPYFFLSYSAVLRLSIAWNLSIYLVGENSSRQSWIFYNSFPQREYSGQLFRCGGGVDKKYCF